MPRCMKWVAVKDGGPILCGVKAIPKISPFRLVLANFGQILNYKWPKYTKIGVGGMGEAP